MLQALLCVDHHALLLLGRRSGLTVRRKHTPWLFPKSGLCFRNLFCFQGSCFHSSFSSRINFSTGRSSHSTTPLARGRGPLRGKVGAWGSDLSKPDLRTRGHTILDMFSHRLEHGDGMAYAICVQQHSHFPSIALNRTLPLLGCVVFKAPSV